MNRRRKAGFLVAAVLLAVWLLPVRFAMAAPDLSISVQAGLDHKTKQGESTPLVITITNKGSAFSGDLVVDTTSGRSSGIGQAVPVTLGNGEERTVTLLVDSLEDPNNFGNQVKKNIFLYEDGWKQGKEVPHSGTQLVTAVSYPAETLFVAGLAENIDRLSTLKDIQLSGHQGMEFLNMSKPDGPPLPEEAAGWAAADIIAVDRRALADLSAKQQKAIVDWVEGGGTLLLGASDNAAAEAGPFRDHLPLQLGESHALSPGLFGEKFKEPVPGYQASLTKGAVSLAGKEGSVLAASKPLGNGLVIQTSFTIGSDAFRTSLGARQLWEDLLNRRSGIVKQQQYQSFPVSPSDDLIWTVGETNELFPSFKVSTPVLFGAILVYMVLIIPLLYVMLRKKDKREHAWWIIPAAAVLVSVAIFAYGGKDRLGKARLQHAAVYEVQTDGRLTGYYMESLLTDKSGEFQFTIQNPSTFSVNSSSDNLFGGNVTSHDKAIVERGSGQAQLFFRDLGFWNVASFSGKTEVPDAGRFDTDLRLENGRLTGTITNAFPFRMEDVTLLSGSKKISFGDADAGETIEVDQDVRASVLGPRNAGQPGYGVQMASNRSDLMEMRKSGLLEFSSIHLNDSSRPVLAGTAEAQLMDVSLNGRKAETSPLSVLLQPVDIASVLAGTVKVDSDLMEVELLSDSGQIAELLDDTTKEYIFSEEVYTQTWQLPEQLPKAMKKWTGLQLVGVDPAKYKVRILNTAAGEYETLEGTSTLTADPADQYVSKDGKVTVQLTFPVNHLGEPVHPPELRLTGEAAK